MLLAIMFPCIGILFIGGAFLYIKLDNNKGKNKKKNINLELENELENDPKKQSELRKFIGLNDIKNDKIILKDGSIRIILNVSSSDFELLTDAEQSSMELALVQFALSLSYPIQFFTTPTRIETKEPSKSIENLINSSDPTISDKLKQHSNRLLISLKKLENERGVYVRRSFCIIGIDNVSNEQRALNELQHRVNTITSKLLSARMRINLLNSNQIAQLLTDVLQKGSNVLIEQLVKDGILELYSEGSGIVVFSEEQIKEEFQN